MPEFYSREELLGGLPARQASTILFAIESRTAYLVGQTRLVAVPYMPQKTAQAREQEFLQALARGRDQPLQPAIQDLERYAPQWAALVPDNPGVRAAIAHMLADNYNFTAQAVPALRQALGLDTEAVREAYQAHYDQPLEKIFAPQLPLKEQLHWRWAGLARWLEELPPFWTTYVMTITNTFGTSILALPIALAGIGPIAGMILVAVVGLINILTYMSVVEVISRNGNMRYGNNFFGRLVADYLGKTGTFILTSALFIFVVLVLVAMYVGLPITLADATGLPAGLWAAILFMICFYYLRRESLDATVPTALVISAINISLVLILSLLALAYIRLENLQYVNVPFINDRPLDVAILALFAVVLTAYTGHLGIANTAKVVLRRDPGGTALMWGNIAAMTTVMGLYTLWVFAMNGAIAPNILANTSGTVLTPLADVIGPVVWVLGTIFVILGIGIGAIYFSLTLFYQVREWLPVYSPLNEASQSASGLAKRFQALFFSRRGRFWLGVAPVGLIFLLVEWLLWTEQESFSGPLAVVGVIVAPLLAGIFPMLMLAASRRKGDYVPGLVWRFMGHPVMVIGLYLVFLAGIFIYGLFIWSDPGLRLLAVLTGMVILVMTFVVIRRGAFSPRTVVELRANPGPNRPAIFTLTGIGKPLLAEVHLNYQEGEQHLRAATGEIPDFNSLQSTTFQLPPLAAKEIKIWLHQVNQEDFSESLPAQVTIQSEQERREFNLTSSNGQMILPYDGEACRIEISFAAKSVSDLLGNL